jgi:hypothetical protein
LDRFVGAVHRRHVLLRVLECAGLGLLAGCVVAAVLAVILLARGRDAWTVSGSALAGGAMVGAVWAILRRPTPLSAASEADRQFGTSDLISTAWTLSRTDGDDDPWRRTVLALAAARCHQLSPSTVLLHRLGLRAWGGIAFSVAFVATLAALSSTSLQASRSSQAVAGKTADASRKPIVEIALAPTRTQRRVEQSPGDERRIGNELSKDIPVTDPKEPNPARSGDERDQRPGASSPGAGAGQAKGNVQDPPRNPADPDSAGLPTGTGAAATTHTAGGVGRAADAPATSGSVAGGVIQLTPSTEMVPPWRDNSWPQAVESAGRAVQSGRVPDDYRDLVREFFDPTELPANAGR